MCQARRVAGSVYLTLIPAGGGMVSDFCRFNGLSSSETIPLRFCPVGTSPTGRPAFEDVGFDAAAALLFMLVRYG